MLLFKPTSDFDGATERTTELKLVRSTTSKFVFGDCKSDFVFLFADLGREEGWRYNLQEHENLTTSFVNNFETMYSPKGRHWKDVLT